MTDIDDFERISWAWLREGPDQLSDRVLGSALAEIHLTTQRRRWAAWRLPDMPSMLKIPITLAIAMIVAAGGYALVSRQPSIGATSSPTSSAPTTPPTPTASAPTGSPPAPVALVPFQSPRYQYSMDRPATWTTVTGTQDWAPDTIPSPGGVSEDRFVSDVDPQTWILATSDALRAGEQPVARQSKLDQENATVCSIPGQAGGLRGTTTVVIDGVSARREAWDCGEWTVSELFFVHADRVYLIDLASKGHPLTDADKATLERMLATFRFR
jgi:hypothetical protein